MKTQLYVAFTVIVALMFIITGLMFAGLSYTTVALICLALTFVIMIYMAIDDNIDFIKDKIANIK